MTSHAIEGGGSIAGVDLVETVAALRDMPDVLDAVVTERAGPGGSITLVGYVTGPDPSRGTASIRRFLHTRLPGYQIPEHLVVLDELPLTADGDYDLAALPAPRAKDRPVDSYVAPRTPMEQRLAGIMTDVLGVDRLGIHDNFFGLGGSSVMAFQLTARIEEVYDVKLTLQDVFASSTVDGLAQLILQTLGERVVVQKAESRRARTRVGLKALWRVVHGALPLFLRRLLPPGVPCVTARSFEEYEAMFALSADDLAGSILDCHGGMSSFAAEMSARDVSATVTDPAYDRPYEDLVSLVAEWLRDSERITDANPGRYVWHWYQSAERRNWMKQNAAASFLDDIRKNPSRYVAASLPTLPFPDDSFDLVLCSHLFRTANSAGYEWYVGALSELVRVARREVRVFPLVVQGTGDPVPFLDELRDALVAAGHKNEVRTVPFEFQAGGNAMLAISAR